MFAFRYNFCKRANIFEIIKQNLIFTVCAASTSTAYNKSQSQRLTLSVFQKGEQPCRTADSKHFYTRSKPDNSILFASRPWYGGAWVPVLLILLHGIKIVINRHVSFVLIEAYCHSERRFAILCANSWQHPWVL